jgi:hypothetical protein
MKTTYEKLRMTRPEFPERSFGVKKCRKSVMEMSYEADPGQPNDARASRQLKVLLVSVEPDLRVFHAEEFESDDVETAEPGVRGWAERRLRRLKAGFLHSQNGAARFTRRFWSWLNQWVHPDEPLLGRLRSAVRVAVEHPSSLTEQEAREAWAALIASSRRRHATWFVVNALVAPLSVLLAPLPGPNLIGYWFAYRAWQDGMILLGIRRVSVGTVEITFQHNPDLAPVRDDPRGRPAALPSQASHVA